MLFGQRVIRGLASIGFLLIGVNAVRATAPSDLFREQIAPIFERGCLSCHNASDRKGSLSLESAEGLRRGGESGAVVEPGKPDKSRLIEYVSGAKPEMPKEGKPLSPVEIA